MFADYFRTVFSSKNYARPHGLLQLFTVNGVAAIASHYILHGIPTQDELQRLLTEGFTESNFLLCTVTFAVILLLACLSNPCHPVVQFTIDIAYYFAESALAERLGRHLYPWEEGLLLFLLHACVMYAYRAEFSRAALARRFAGQVARRVVWRMALYALDQHVLGDRVQLYVMMLLGYGELYGGRALEALRERQRPE